jgi:UDP-N-acetylmuramoyl-L-alanyl-D-glutamate--2,6-diaminopimelate ligase
LFLALIYNDPVSLIFRVRKLYHFVKSLLLKALPAVVKFGFPGRRLKVYGITGTDGKTTSSTMLYHVLKTAGYKVALISTVAAYIGDEEIDTGFHVTSPEHWQVQQLLKRCVDAGIEHVVLEVTSHGIFQYRTWGIPFILSGITNVSEEHLDYFVNYDLYLRTKAELLLKAEKAAIPAEERCTKPLRALLKSAGKNWIEYSPLAGSGAVEKAIKTRFAENYNRKNAQLVRTMAYQIGVTDDVLEKAFRSFPGVKGRMQEMPNDLGIKIVVDFAHTPQAQEAVLTALRPQTEGRLWVVFGCAGLRDHTKRPKMGNISTSLADMAIFTAEDPRTEKLQVIFRQMKEGVASKNKRKVITIPDRMEAITYAIQNAKKGDTIAILGKGHEMSMCFGRVETPWSDQQAVKDLVKKV